MPFSHGEALAMDPRLRGDILDAHVGHCVAAAAHGPAEAQAEKIAELTALLKRAMR